MNQSTSKKDTELKIRLSQKDKADMQSLADKNTNGNLSNYILQKCLYEARNDYYFLSQQIETWNYINSLHHLIEDAGTEQMKAEFAKLHQIYVNSQRKEQEDE